KKGRSAWSTSRRDYWTIGTIGGLLDYWCQFILSFAHRRCPARAARGAGRASCRCTRQRNSSSPTIRSSRRTNRSFGSSSRKNSRQRNIGGEPFFLYLAFTCPHFTTNPFCS